MKYLKINPRYLKDTPLSGNIPLAPHSKDAEALQKANKEGAITSQAKYHTGLSKSTVAKRKAHFIPRTDITEKREIFSN